MVMIFSNDYYNCCSNFYGPNLENNWVHDSKTFLKKHKSIAPITRFSMGLKTYKLVFSKNFDFKTIIQINFSVIIL
jgi:hypothetical protein